MSEMIIGWTSNSTLTTIQSIFQSLLFIVFTIQHWVHSENMAIVIKNRSKAGNNLIFWSRKKKYVILNPSFLIFFYGFSFFCVCVCWGDLLFVCFLVLFCFGFYNATIYFIRIQFVRTKNLVVASSIQPPKHLAPLLVLYQKQCYSSDPSLW